MQGCLNLGDFSKPMEYIRLINLPWIISQAILNIVSSRCELLRLIMTVRVRFWFDSNDFYMSVINSHISEESNSKISVGPPKESSVDKMGWLNETYL